MSFNRGEFFDIDALSPFLKRGRILSLRFDLEKITFRYHQPKGAMFAFVLESFETIVTIDVDRFGIPFRGRSGEFPRRGRRLHVIGIGCGIENTDRGRRHILAFAFVVIAVHVC